MPYPRPLSQEMTRTEADLAAHWDALAHCASVLGFGLPDPSGTESSRAALGKYLKACGVRRFSIGEVVTPHRVSRARSVGYDELVPPAFTWPWVGVLLRVGDALRDVNGEPLTLRNLWRPQSYNALVAKSAKSSDHPNACGADFVFTKIGHRRKAEGYLHALARVVPELQLSVGFGFRNLHVGVRSPKGSRSWWYGSYPDTRVKIH